jgi:hypothetical protein
LSATSASKIASTICPRARKTAHQQILFHRERREQRARLRHLQQAGADDLARRAPGDLRAVEMDAAIDNLPVFLLEHAGDRLQNGRFAGAIGTEQRHDRAGRHIERHIAHGLDRAIVKNLHVFQRQHGIIRGRLCENDERRADESFISVGKHGCGFCRGERRRIAGHRMPLRAFSAQPLQAGLSSNRSPMSPTFASLTKGLVKATCAASSYDE